jgi:hypothetical protein
LKSPSSVQHLIYSNWLHGGYFEISVSEDGQNPLAILKAIPSSLLLLDAHGLKYGASFVLFYDHGSQKLLFDKPGTYWIRYFLSKTESYPIEVSVSESTAYIKDAISLLSDHRDYLLLELGIESEKHEEKIESILHLQQVVERFKDTLLAKWSAARVGLESFRDAEKERTKLRREKKPIDKELWDESAKYLRKGLELPDDFPIRQEVLYRLIEFEGKKENYSQSILYSDELTAKYPEGEYGKKASKGKRKLLELQEKKSKQAP